MTRYFWICIATTGLVAGCGRSTPPVPPPPATAAPVVTATDPVLKPDTTATPPSTPTPSPMANPAGGLRDVLARYLDADGQGGFRPNEKAATEVEKLAPPASQLIALLPDPQVEVRRGAAFYLLSLFDPASPEQVKALSGLLADQDRAVRSIGRSAVAQMHTPDQVAAVPQLAALLSPEREAKPDSRAAIARLFASLKAEAAAAVPALTTSAAGDPDAKVRSASIAALAQIVPPAEAIAPLAKGLSDADAAVRVVATAQLKRLAAAAAPVAKELAAALGDADQRVRENAAAALILIGAPAVEPLTAALGSGNVEARKYALVSLAKIGPPAKAAIPAIEKAGKDSDADVQKLAAEALKRIGPP